MIGSALLSDDQISDFKKAEGGKMNNNIYYKMMDEFQIPYLTDMDLIKEKLH